MTDVKRARVRRDAAVCGSDRVWLCRTGPFPSSLPLRQLSPARRFLLPVAVEASVLGRQNADNAVAYRTGAKKTLKNVCNAAVRLLRHDPALWCFASLTSQESDGRCRVVMADCISSRVLGLLSNELYVNPC